MKALPESIEDIIAASKERQKTAEHVEVMQNLKEEGLLPNTTDKREVTAYERAAATITKGLHEVTSAKATLQHANIPTKVLAPVLEIIIITESMIEELKECAQKKTFDELTLEENRLLTEEAIRIMVAIPIVLTAKDGYRSVQAVENLRSLVTGESMMRANEASAMGFGQSKGVLGTIKNWFVGAKK